MERPSGIQSKLLLALLAVGGNPVIAWVHAGRFDSIHLNHDRPFHVTGRALASVLESKHKEHKPTNQCPRRDGQGRDQAESDSMSGK